MNHWTKNQLKLRAHEVLDDVKHGLPVAYKDIVWALRVLGDMQ